MRGAVCAALLAVPAQAEILFEDRSDALPQHVYDGGWEHFVGGGVAVFDCNGDGLPEIFAAGGTNRAALFENHGEFIFKTAPLPELTGVTGAYPLDIDSDGHLDLMVLRVGRNVLLKGDGACGFQTSDISLDHTDRWTTAFSAHWDGGEWPVLAFGNYVDRTNPDGPFEACDANELHRWDGGYLRQDLTPGYCVLSILFARDASGITRLRLSNDRHYYVRDGAEQMYDLAEERFLGVEDGWPRISLWGMGIASRDITGDGRSEVMLTSMGDQLLKIATEEGLYRNAPFEMGTTAHRPHMGDDGRPSTGWHAEWADVDNDGRADLFIAKGNVDQMPGLAIEDPNSLLHQQPDGTFAEVAGAAGVGLTARSRGAALADFDRDGRLDLVVVNRRAPIALYRNTSQQTGNWLQISLRQEGTNTRAVGGMVRVMSDPAQAQEITIGGGHAGGQAGPLHFGLGEVQSVDVEITWPDGSRTLRQDIAVNQRLTIHR